MTPLVILGALVLAAGSTPADLEARFAAALDSGRADRALAIADSIVHRREARHAKPLDVAACADSLALGFFALGTPEGWSAAEHLFEHSLEIRRKALGPRDLQVALTLAALAILDDYEGEWASGVKRAEEALAIRRERVGPKDLLIASSMRQVGMLRFALGDYAAAESLVVTSLAIHETLEGDQTERIADNLNNLGEIARAQDQYGRAEAYFRRGEQVGRGLPEDSALRISLLNNLGGVYRDLGRYSDAVPLDEESLRLQKSSPDTSPELLAIGHLSLAELYRLQGRNDEAVPLYQKALELARPALGEGNPYLAPFVNQAAVSFSEAGRLDLAEPLFREALETTERALGPDHPLVAQTLADLGRLEERRGAFAAAESAYTRAIAIRVARLGARHPDVAVTRVDLARCLAAMPGRGDRAARAELGPAIAILDSSRAYPDSRLEAHALMAAVDERAKNNAEALRHLDASLDLLDSLRAQRGGGDATRASLVAKYLPLYDRAITLQLASGNADQALATHERSRARVLRDQIATAGVDLTAGIPEAERAPLIRKQDLARLALAQIQRAMEQAYVDPNLAEAARIERIQALEHSRDSAASEIQRVTESLEDRSPVWRSIITRGGRVASRADLQKALHKDDLLLEYHTGDSASWVFVAAADGKPARAFALNVDAGTAKDLGMHAGPLRSAALERSIAGDTTRPRRPTSIGISEMLADPQANLETLERRLHALMRVLVPIELIDRLKRAKAVVIVPDGALHLIPFETLVATPSSGNKPARYWLDVGPPVRYEASSTSLVQLEARRASASTAQKEVLSVSNPSFAQSAEYPPLPGTRLETAAIRAALGAARMDSLEGARATEPAVRAALPAHRVLHLATHGFVTERKSEVLAGLVFAPADSARADADGLLQLYEIYGMKLDADLALLSACETARGPRVAGEGVFALSRGFLAAGARRVIASLWRVNDASTADLIGSMFRGLAQKPDADWTDLLFQAKRAVRSNPKTAEPFYWAPFVISGAR